MRKLSANYIFPGCAPPLKNGILVCNDNGSIKELIDTGGLLMEIAGLEYYNGILIPGLINTHCHLELSWLKGKIQEKTGIGKFIGEINRLRNEDVEQAENEIEKADSMLRSTGTVAVGDVSNFLLSIPVKKKSQIYYHTFVETFGFHPSRAEKAFKIAVSVEKTYFENDLIASVVPHSPYSVSIPLFEKIKEKALTSGSLMSIHNQESEGEELFFRDGSGPIAEHLNSNLGIDISHFKPTGKSSLISVLPFLPAENPLLLVHNTFTSQNDINNLANYRSIKNTFFVLCPNSNLYIENKLPPVDLFRKNNLIICLGTDSLASNHQLSILSEMITLQQNFPEITLDNIVKWSSYNGAMALQADKYYGSFEPGKKPGVNLITGVDLQNLRLTSNSRINRLL